MAVATMLLVCNLKDGCLTRDGTVQPQGTAVERVVTDEDGSSYPVMPGYVLIKDDKRPLYVQNSGVNNLAVDEILPEYINDAAAIADGLAYGKSYSNSLGYTVQLKEVK